MSFAVEESYCLPGGWVLFGRPRAEELITQLVEAKWTKLKAPGRSTYKHSSGAKTFWKGKIGWLKFKGKDYKIGNKPTFDKAEKLIGDIMTGKA